MLCTKNNNDIIVTKADVVEQIDTLKSFIQLIRTHKCVRGSEKFKSANSVVKAYNLFLRNVCFSYDGWFFPKQHPNDTKIRVEGIHGRETGKFLLAILAEVVNRFLFFNKQSFTDSLGEVTLLFNTQGYLFISIDLF